MTAVEWLLGNLITEPYSEADFEHNEECWDKAKEMEKEQIMDAIKFTIQDEFTKQTWKNGKCSHDTALNYYNETFKSE